jgi:chromosome partitioning protein
MILTVGNTKGGVGKTMLAVNITIARSLLGSDVLLIDGDEQNTALTFTELRSSQLGNVGYTAVSLHGAAIRTQVRQLTPKYTDIVIDVGGRNTGSLRAALTVTNTLLIPVQPRSFDIWAIDQIADLVREAHEINPKMWAVIILNIADTQGRDNQDTAEALQDIEGIEFLEISIGRRKAFPNAASAGKAVLEQSPKDRKAVEELTALLQVIYKQEDRGMIYNGNR